MLDAICVAMVEELGSESAGQEEDVEGVKEIENRSPAANVRKLRPHVLK